MMVMRIRGFSEEFETSESRKLKCLPWIALPTKQEGDGYTELMSGHDNGCAHFGAWTAMLQLAAKCSPRGTLVRNLGGKRLPHDAKSISRITRVPVDVLTEAIPRLIEMGWMENAELTDDSHVLPTPPRVPGEAGELPGAQDRRGQERTGQDSTAEGEDTATTPSASPVPESAPEAIPPDAKKQKRRLDLLITLKANNAKLSMGEENIFEEWIEVTDGYRLDWIGHLMESARPRLKLPSALRVELKRQSSAYQTWTAK